MIYFSEQGEKRKVSPVQANGDDTSTKKLKISSEDKSEKKADILDALLKNVSRGYGDNGNEKLLCTIGLNVSDWIGLLYSQIVGWRNFQVEQIHFGG